MKISQEGISLIKKFEGCELEAYQDAVGIWTIGYGHIKGVKEGMTITKQQAEEMLINAGFKNVNGYDGEYAIGLGIHEMGTARMGRDVKTSVLNGNNQVHEVPNVYVTDGSAMTSAGNVNPSLTYMALTARAANHAVEELKKMNL